MPKIKNIRFGLVRELPKDAEESRIIPFVLSTFTKDRHGTVLNQENWQIENYKRNPVVAYQHTLSGGMCSDPDPDYAIGKDVAIAIEGSARERRLVGAIEFEPASINPLAEKIFRKVLFGTLSMASVGFIEVGEGRYGDGEEARGKDGETYYFDGQELLEWSIVNIPSNPDAGKRLRVFREHGYSALMYAFRELGGKLRLSQIEDLTVRQVLDLLEGKDLGIKESDPEKVRLMLEEEKQKRLQELRKLELSGL